MIGAKDYDPKSGLAPLRTPLNDASAVAEAFQKIGIATDHLPNPTTDQLRAALTALKQKLPETDVVLVYYAGHGFQATLDGAATLKFFLPIDFRWSPTEGGKEKEATLVEAIARREIVSIEEIHDAIRSSGKVGISFWDACRNNPYYTTHIAIPRDATRALAAVRPYATRSAASRGLTSEPLPSSPPAKRISTGPRGIVVQSATQPGQLADDGAGRHSPYTEAVLKHISRPGIPIETLLKAIATDVDQLTSGVQKPQIENDLIGGDVYLVPAAATAVVPKPASAPPSTGTATRSTEPRRAAAPSGGAKMPKSCDNQPCRSDATLPGGNRVIIHTTPINPY